MPCGLAGHSGPSSCVQAPSHIRHATQSEHPRANNPPPDIRAHAMRHVESSLRLRLAAKTKRRDESAARAKPPALPLGNFQQAAAAALTHRQLSRSRRGRERGGAGQGRWAVAHSLRIVSSSSSSSRKNDRYWNDTSTSRFAPVSVRALRMACRAVHKQRAGGARCLSERVCVCVNMRGREGRA